MSTEYINKHHPMLNYSISSYSQKLISGEMSPKHIEIFPLMALHCLAAFENSGR